MSTLHAEEIPLPQSRQSPIGEGHGIEVQAQAGNGGARKEEQDGKAVTDVQEESKPEKKDEVEENVRPSESAGKEPVDVSDHDGNGRADKEEQGSHEHTDTDGSPLVQTVSISSSAMRPPTPLSRTSTPPLTAGSGLAGAKKFSRVNVNKKFLSKGASPAAGSPATATKLGLTSSSPVPLNSTSSRLLSTKLTTVPTTSTSPSPLPTGLATTTAATASPWAKPTTSTETPSPSAISGTLHQPAPMRAKVLTTTTIPTPTMGSGQGISASAARAAWRPVAAEGKRAPVGLSRDFPTAKEVADGKRDAQAMAQAKAAHNQAILQGLNAFTQLDANAHRWEDEDDDDEVIDFGDGAVYAHHDHHASAPPEPVIEQPVSKSERFVEDFDRSWPRSRPAAIPEPAPMVGASGLPRRPDTDRVLFNASSNRLEPPSSRLPQPSLSTQQPRLMTRPEPSIQVSDRPLPPHLQAGAEGGRMLPPHMTAHPPTHQSAASTLDRRPQAPVERKPQPVVSSTGRQPWGAQRETDRPPPPHLSENRDPPAQSSAHAGASQASGFEQATRRSFSQMTRPGGNQPETVTPAVPTAPGVDSQTAEMHSAAEKARLRRLAEEQEREAAAERARRKAKELAERFGAKDVKSPSESPAVIPSIADPVQPSVTKTGPIAGFTLAQRPTPRTEAPVPSASLPSRPAPETRSAEGLWRSRTEAATIIETRGEHSQPQRAPRSQGAPQAQQQRASLPPSSILSPPSRDAPFHVITPPAQNIELTPELVDAVKNQQSPDKAPRREQNFDSMLARIQAAMAEARSTPDLTSPETELDILPQLAIRPPKLSNEAEEKAASPPPPPAIPEYFEVTQLEIPKSPPPAWRTYSVKIPKPTSSARPSIAISQIKAFENYRRVPPKGWMMSFDPPIEHISTTTFSRSDLFLPQPVVRRFTKHLEMGPNVSISPRKLEPYQKKGKKRLSYDTSRSTDAIPSATVADSLLPPNGLSASAQLRSQAQPQPKAPAAQQPFSGASAKTNLPVEQPTPERWMQDAKGDTSVEQIKKPRSPVKASQAAKAEKQGLFSAEGVGIGNAAQRDRASSDAKPGVRFMVSSELEGDSLLDEVNKISLEMVGEGSDEKSGERRERGEANESPNTPPALANNAGRTAGSSPNGNAVPWAQGSTRNAAQHDHLKSVWEQTPASSSEAARPDNAYASVSVGQPAAQSGDAPAPLYPSLNAPSTDSHANQSLPAGVKMAYNQSQAFSPSGSQTTFARPPQYGGYSPDSHAVYTRTANGAANAAVYGMQQAVWSPSAFGTGYGYSKHTAGGAASGMDHKAAMAFANASGKDVYGALGNDYRYTQQQQQQQQQQHAQSQQSQQSQQPQHAQHAQQNPSSFAQYSSAQSPQSPYTTTPFARQNMTSPSANMYGYYGAPGQTASTGAGRGRFGHASANVANGGGMNGEYAYTGMEGGYYGGVGGGGAGQQQYYAHAHAAQAGHGAIGSHQQQQHHQAGRGSAGGNAAQRKMWQ